MLVLSLPWVVAYIGVALKIVIEYFLVTRKK